MRNLQPKTRSHWKWKPAYSGIFGNELADKIANYAARALVIGREPFVTLHNVLSKRETWDWLAQQIDIAWRTSDRCQHTKQFINCASRTLKNQIVDMNDSDGDPCGRAREIAMHIICECSILIDTEKIYLKKNVMHSIEICKMELITILEFYKECCTRLTHPVKVI